MASEASVKIGLDSGATSWLFAIPHLFRNRSLVSLDGLGVAGDEARVRDEEGGF